VPNTGTPVCAKHGHIPTATTAIRIAFRSTAPFSLRAEDRGRPEIRAVKRDSTSRKRECRGRVAYLAMALRRTTSPFALVRSKTTPKKRRW